MIWWVSSRGIWTDPGAEVRCVYELEHYRLRVPHGSPWHPTNYAHILSISRYATCHMSHPVT